MQVERNAGPEEIARSATRLAQQLGPDDPSDRCRELVLAISEAAIARNVVFWPVSGSCELMLASKVLHPRRQHLEAGRALKKKLNNEL